MLDTTVLESAARGIKEELAEADPMWFDRDRWLIACGMEG